jgi:hypothetical protein
MMAREQVSLPEAATAYHEAGHAVAHIYYFRTDVEKVSGLRRVSNGLLQGEMTATVKPPTIRRYKEQPDGSFVLNDAEAARLTERHVLMLLAGEAAMRRWAALSGRSVPVQVDHRDSDDRQIARYRLPEATLLRLQKTIDRLLAQPDVWGAVENLATHIMRYGHASGRRGIGPRAARPGKALPAQGRSSHPRRPLEPVEGDQGRGAARARRDWGGGPGREDKGKGGRELSTLFHKYEDIF